MLLENADKRKLPLNEGKKGARYLLNKAGVRFVPIAGLGISQ
jgi:hypothetical protein